jgi:hypothetical protein
MGKNPPEIKSILAGSPARHYPRRSAIRGASVRTFWSEPERDYWPLGVFDFRCDEDGNVGVCISPQGEEIMVGGKRLNAGGVGVRSVPRQASLLGLGNLDELLTPASPNRIRPVRVVSV